MNSANLRIAWLWVGVSAAGLLVGSALAIALFPTPPVDPMAPETIGNRFDPSEAIFALAVSIPFALFQWGVLHYVLAVRKVAAKAKTLLWVPVTGVGVAAIVFLIPPMDLSFSWSRLIALTLPPIVALGLAQWHLLRWLIRARKGWILLTVVGGEVGVIAATVAGFLAGLAGWAIALGACIGLFQAPALVRELAEISKRLGLTTGTRHGTGETIAGIALVLVLFAAITPSLLQPDFRNVNSVAYSPDGMRIAADVENFVYLWDAETGELIFAIDSGPGARVWNPGHDLTFSADGSRIAVSSYMSGVIIIDGETGERLVTIDDYLISEGVGDIAFSPNESQLLLALQDGNVGLYDAIDGRLLTGFQSSIRKDINPPILGSVAFSPDGRTVAAGGNYWPKKGPPEGFAAFWDVDSGHERFVVTGHTMPVQHVVFSQDNTRVMTVGGEKVNIWDTSSGATLAIPRPDCSGIVDAVFKKGGNHIAIACADGTVHQCDATSGQCSIAFSPPSSAADGIVAIDFHPDGNRIAAAALLGSISIWNMETGKRIRKLKMPNPG